LDTARIIPTRSHTAKPSTVLSTPLPLRLIQRNTSITANPMTSAAQLYADMGCPSSPRDLTSGTCARMSAAKKNIMGTSHWSISAFSPNAQTNSPKTIPIPTGMMNLRSLKSLSRISARSDISLS